MEKNLTPQDYHFFRILGLLAIAMGWFAFALTLGGFFAHWLVFLGTIAILGGFGYWVISRKLLSDLSREFILFGIIFLSATIVFSFFVVPTIFSGRDQGSISEAAIRLSQNQKLEFSTPESEIFFKAYGAGRALNFPGFHYAPDGNLVTQFPLVYTAWLALFYAIFGLSGLIIANAFLFFVFIFSLYLLFRLFAEAEYGKIFALLILTSFIFSWILKFTLSENIAMTLLWFGILELVQFLREPKNLKYASLIATFGLLAFTRIEGIAFLAVIVTILIFTTRKNEFWKDTFKAKIISPSALFILILGADIFRNFYFYKEIGKVIFSHSKNGIPSAFNIWSFLSNITYTGKIFALYGSISFLIIGLIGIGYYLRKREWNILIPFFVALPSFTYLVDANISADHPWMLRRFVFSIIPALILYSVLFLIKFFADKKKFWLWTILIIIFLLGAYPFGKFLAFSDNRGLLESTQKLAQSFSANDLILVDRLTSGSGWSMPVGPMSFLFDKHAVYFFNPNDLAKIDLQKFAKVYLIVSDENLSFYQDSVIGSQLINPKDYSLSTSQLDTNELVRLPQKETFQATGKIFEITK